MDDKSFDYKRIAEGYANDRPFLHEKVINLLKEDLQIGQNFSNGLDVGCGAGLSTKALKMICDKVTGTDISGEMIEAAKTLYTDSAYMFLKCSAEEIRIPDQTFDIVTAAGVVNWVDERKFLSNLRGVMDKGLLIIYDFWITDKMKENPAYTDWWHDSYLKMFPKPPRKEKVWTKELTQPYGFEQGKQVSFSLAYEFDRDAFVRFMMIQSNVNVQVDEKGRPAWEVRSWFDSTLSPVFGHEKKTLIFDGYYWCFSVKQGV